MIPINNPIGMVARFGQRAAHSLTGWTPQGGLEELRHGSYAAKQSLGALKNKSEAAGKDLTGKFVAPTAREMELAEKRVAATQASQDMGLTNLPGYARALSKDPKATLLTAAGDAWHGMDPMSKSLMIGLPAVQGAMELKNSKEEDPLHRSRLERAAGMGANVAGGLLMSPLTQTMQMGLGPYAGRLGAATGRAADRVSEGASSMIGRARASLAQHASTQAAPAAVPGLAVPQQGAVLDGQPIPR
jgi:hypothetical protein